MIRFLVIERTQVLFWIRETTLFFNELPDGIPMRTLVWNCRGAGNEDFLGVIRDHPMSLR